MSKKKPPLKQRFMLCVLLKSMENMIDKKPCLTNEDIEEEYIKFVKENLEEFVNNPFFRC